MTKYFKGAAGLHYYARLIDRVLDDVLLDAGRREDAAAVAQVLTARRSLRDLREQITEPPLPDGMLSAEQVRARRLALGISQTRLAQMVGTPAPLICRIEQGQQRISQAMAERLNRALVALEAERAA